MPDPKQLAARALASRSHLVAYEPRVSSWRRAASKFYPELFCDPLECFKNSASPWKDEVSFKRERGLSWRSRTGYLDGHEVTYFHYVVCRACRLGFVRSLWTHDPHQRCGLMRAGLEAVRLDTANLDISWHELSGTTLSEHVGPWKPFWDKVGADVKGGYSPRELCEHIVE